MYRNYVMIASSATTAARNEVKTLSQYPDAVMTTTAHDVMILLDQAINLRNDMIRLEISRGVDIHSVSRRYKLSSVRIAYITNTKKHKKVKKKSDKD